MITYSNMPQQSQTIEITLNLKTWQRASFLTRRNPQLDCISATINIWLCKCNTPHYAEHCMLEWWTCMSTSDVYNPDFNEWILLVLQRLLSVLNVLHKKSKLVFSKLTILSTWTSCSYSVCSLLQTYLLKLLLISACTNQLLRDLQLLPSTESR
jgi:hypothetical protein